MRIYLQSFNNMVQTFTNINLKKVIQGTLASFILFLILLSSCTKQKVLSKETREDAELARIRNAGYEFYINKPFSNNLDFEMGDMLSFLSYHNRSVMLKIPIKATFTLYMPDGSSIQNNFSIVNYPVLHPCDPLPDGSGCPARKEYDYSYEPTWSSELNFGPATQTGKYRIMASAEDDILKIHEFLFEVKPSRIGSLFILEEVGGYKFSDKKKIIKRYPFPAESNFIYFASYLRTKKINVEIELTNSSEEARQHSNYFVKHDEFGNVDFSDLNNYKFDEKGQLIREGNNNIYFMEKEKPYFIVKWPSWSYVIRIDGFQKYQDNEKQFVSEYLKKYPSTLKS